MIKKHDYDIDYLISCEWDDLHEWENCEFKLDCTKEEAIAKSSLNLSPEDIDSILQEFTTKSWKYLRTEDIVSDHNYLNRILVFDFPDELFVGCY